MMTMQDLEDKLFNVNWTPLRYIRCAYTVMIACCPIEFSFVCTPPLQLTRDYALKESTDKSILIGRLRQEIQEHLSTIHS